jgi:hypothetical protein
VARRRRRRRRKRWKKGENKREAQRLQNVIIMTKSLLKKDKKYDNYSE